MVRTKNSTNEVSILKRLAVDLCVFQSYEKAQSTEFGIKVLLIRRQDEPFAGEWSLVGGAVEENSILHTVHEKVKKKLGVALDETDDFYMEQLCTYDDDDANTVKRDPRNSVVTVAHIGILRQGAAGKALDEPGRQALQGQLGQQDLQGEWFDISIGSFGNFKIIALQSIQGNASIIYEWHMEKKTYSHREGDEIAFDHIRIIHEAFERIAGKIEYTDIVFKFLPVEFTVRNMQSIMQLFTGQHDPHFRRRFAGWITETGGELRGLANRPAKLYERRVGSND